MRNFVVLMSHDMSEIQKNDAYEKLKVTKIIEAPSEIKKIWGNINPISNGIALIASLEVSTPNSNNNTHPVNTISHDARPN